MNVATKLQPTCEIEASFSKTTSYTCETFSPSDEVVELYHNQLKAAADELNEAITRAKLLINREKK